MFHKAKIISSWLANNLGKALKTRISFASLLQVSDNWRRAHSQDGNMKINLSSFTSPIARPAVCRTGTGPRASAGWNSLKLGVVLLAMLGVGAARSLASDPIGIYALVDKVVLEPNETNPERIQIRGAFAVAEGNGYTYKKAERGYLYYKVNPDKPAACHNEWADLKSVAGTGQIVAFGSRYGEKGTLRKQDAKPANPDLYPVAMGLTRVKEEKDYEPLKQLAKLRDAKPAGPNPPAQKKSQ
jgi:hypothetical protein